MFLFTGFYKLTFSIGMVVSGAFLVGFCFVNSMLPAVVVLVLCLGLHSGVHVGFHVSKFTNGLCIGFKLCS